MEKGGGSGVHHDVLLGTARVAAKPFSTEKIDGALADQLRQIALLRLEGLVTP
ncbi:hypothetical protein [Kocuria arenosa]|uniref:hypothetical protein n=1 Tax=Kocuria arenosa TaxID=3071446 RepID=UPI0034D540B2